MTLFLLSELAGVGVGSCQHTRPFAKDAVPSPVGSLLKG